MGWFDLTNETWVEQNESGWESLADNTPSSVSGSVYWLTVNNFDFALINETQWQEQQESLHTDPPYIASGYVSGVCNHSVVIISN